MRAHLLSLVLLVVCVGCGSERRADTASDSGPAGVDAGRSDAGPTDSGAASGTYIVDFDTTAGSFAMEVDESWAPLGAARVRELVESGFYDGAKFFRVIPGFVVQFGLAADPAVSARWRDMRIADDPVMASNTRGTVSFATAGPGTRTTQLFINLVDNSSLDAMGFAPIGTIVEGMANVDMINGEYGGMPSQARIQTEGDAYLSAEFPRLDGINAASIR